MTSFLGNLSNYMFGGNTTTNEEKENENENENINENNNNNNETIKLNENNVYASADGELWKFHAKKEDWKLLKREVTAVIVLNDDNNNEYSSILQIIDSNSNQVLISEEISNNLHVQYNKKKHTMIFLFYNSNKNRLDVLSFLFLSQNSENNFKYAMSIKLFETNRQESFDKYIKNEEDKIWIKDSHEIESNNSNNNNNNFDDDGDIIMDDNVNSINLNNNKEEINKHMTGSKKYNRTYVIRDLNNKNKESLLGFFKHDNNNELVYEGKLSLQDLNKKSFLPSSVVQYYGDKRLLMLRDDNPGLVTNMDIEKGKIINEWQIKEDGYGEIEDITNLTKNGELNDIDMFYGITHNNMFTVDGRVNTKNKIVKEKQYKTRINQTCINTSNNGFIATGSEDGTLRLYNQLGKMAKTLLPGLGDNIKYVDITNDGNWICATCKDYIMVIPTFFKTKDDEEYTGFEKRMPKNNKPRPYILRIKNNDLIKYNLHKVNFSNAKFDNGNNSNFVEESIVSSTGPYIIKWDFNALKKYGILDRYSIRKAQTNIIHNEFRFNKKNDLLISEKDNVYVQHVYKKNKN